MSKVSSQKKSDSRDVEIKKLTQLNDKSKSQNSKLQEENLKLKRKIFNLEKKVSALETKVSEKGRTLENLIEEDMKENNKID